MQVPLQDRTRQNRWTTHSLRPGVAQIQRDQGTHLGATRHQQGSAGRQIDDLADLEQDECHASRECLCLGHSVASRPFLSGVSPRVPGAFSAAPLDSG